MKARCRALWDRWSLFGRIVAISIALAVLCGLIAVVAISLFKRSAANSEEHDVVGVEDYEEYDWEEIVLADMIPKPESSYGHILVNSESLFGLYVEKATQEQFTQYIAACQEKGFTFEAETTDDTFRAFNGQGFKLFVLYSDDLATMNISLEEGEQFGSLTWPDGEMAQVLPVPESSVGRIAVDDGDIFVAKIGNSDMDAFNAYVQACVAKGFTIEASKTDKLYSAKNADQYKLVVQYYGNSVVYITLYAPWYETMGDDDCLESSTPTHKGIEAC